MARRARTDCKTAKPVSVSCVRSCVREVRLRRGQRGSLRVFASVWSGASCMLGLFVLKTLRHSYPPRICDMLLSEVSCKNFVTTSDATSARAAPAAAPAAAPPSAPAAPSLVSRSRFCFCHFKYLHVFRICFFSKFMFSFSPAFFHVVRFTMLLSSFSTLFNVFRSLCGAFCWSSGDSRTPRAVFFHLFCFIFYYFKDFLFNLFFFIFFIFLFFHFF